MLTPRALQDGTSSIPSNKYLEGSATSRTVHAHTTAADVDPDRAQKLRGEPTGSMPMRVCDAIV